MAFAKKQTGTIVIKEPNFKVAILTIVGTSPYVSNRFSQEAREMMASDMAEGSTAKASKGRNKARPPKDFEAGFEGSMHKVNGSPGWIPATSFKAALVRSCSVCGIDMTLAKQCLFVEPDAFDEEGIPLVKITKGKPHRFDAYVRNMGGKPDIRSRAKWDAGWEVQLRIRFDADILTTEHVASLVQRSGISVGVGAGRNFSTASCGCGWGSFAIKED